MRQGSLLVQSNDQKHAKLHRGRRTQTTLARYEHSREIQLTRQLAGWIIKFKRGHIVVWPSLQYYRYLAKMS